MPRIPSSMSLSVFEAAARNLSFSKAAEELSLTPGAVSRQIQSLETALDVKLFERSHKRVSLTDAGRSYRDAIRLPLAELAAATERIRGRGDNAVVSVVAYPTFAIRWFIPRWGRFYDRHPQVDLQLTTSLDPVDFLRGRPDIAICVPPLGEAPAGLVGEKLIEVDLIPVAAPDVAARLHRPDDLAQATLLHGAPRPRDWERWLSTAGLGAAVASIDPTRGLRFESLNLAIQAAIEGLGVAIAIEALVREDLASGRLVEPFGIVRRSRRPIHMMYPEGNAEKRAFRMVRDWLLREAGAASTN